MALYAATAWLWWDFWGEAAAAAYTVTLGFAQKRVADCIESVTKLKESTKKIDLKDIVEDTVYSCSESLDAVEIALAIAAEIGNIEVRGIVAILTKAIPIAVTLVDGAYYIINEIM